MTFVLIIKLQWFVLFCYWHDKVKLNLIITTSSNCNNRTTKYYKAGTKLKRTNKKKEKWQYWSLLFVKEKKAANTGKKERGKERERTRDCTSLHANRGSYGLWSVDSQLQQRYVCALVFTCVYECVCLSVNHVSKNHLEFNSQTINKKSFITSCVYITDTWTHTVTLPAGTREMELSYLIALSAGTAEHSLETANLTTDPLPGHPTSYPLKPESKGKKWKKNTKCERERDRERKERVWVCACEQESQNREEKVRPEKTSLSPKRPIAVIAVGGFAVTRCY